MKIEDIIEMAPYHIEYDPPEDNWIKPNKSSLDIRSMRTINREYEFICDVTLLTDKKPIHLYKHKKMSCVIGGYETIRHSDNEPAFYEVFTLIFKINHTLVNIPEDINESKIIQVDKVNTIPAFRGYGLAGYVYALLALQGYIILSDEDQYDGGVALWKSMARKAKLTDYVINIINVVSGYITDKSGKPIAYDNKNIDEAKIWTKGNNFEGRWTLLMLRKK